MKKHFLLSLFVIFSLPSLAQFAAVKDEALIKTYLIQKQFKLDTTASAIYLNEFCKVIASYSERRFYYEFKVEKLAKIITEEGLDVADVTIDLMPDQELTKGEAVIYTLKDGKVTEHELEQPFKIIGKDNSKTAVLNVKNIKPGSIIYYSYSIKSSGNIIFPIWYIQEKYPKLKSLLQVTSETGIVFIVLSNTNQPFTEANMNELDDCNACCYHDSRANVLEQYRSTVWARKNIASFPAFASTELKPREYLKIQLGSVQNLKFARNANSAGYGSSSERSSEYLADINLQSWQEVNDKLLFGSGKFEVSEGNKAIRNTVKKLVGTLENNVDKAKAIFGYVRDSIRLDADHKLLFDNRKLSSVFDSQSGNVTEKNLLLNAMLNAANIPAAPAVLIKGNNTALRTDISNYSLLDYCVVTFIDGGSRYFLDASTPSASFGTIRADGYNRTGFVVNKSGAFVTIPKAPKEKQVSLINIKKAGGSNEQLEVTMQVKLSKIGSATFREQVFETSGKSDEQRLMEIVSKSLNTKLITWESVKTDQLYDKDSVITIICNGHCKTGDIFTKQGFNPYLLELDEANDAMGLLKTNGPIEYMYTLNVYVPAEYAFTKIPVARNIALADNAISYSSVVDYNDKENVFKLTYSYQDDAKDISNYSAAELSSFFKAIKENQSERVY